MQKDKTLLNSFYEASANSVTRLDMTDDTRRKNYSLIHEHTCKTPNKILVKWIQQCVEKIIHCKFSLSLEYKFHLTLSFVNVILYISRFKKENHRFSRSVSKAFVKKNLGKLGMERNFFNQINSIYQKRWSPLSPLVYTVLVVVASPARQGRKGIGKKRERIRKERRYIGIRSEKAETKLVLSTEDTNVY